MKFSAICLLAAGLAATVAALPPQLRDRELPPGAYWEGDVLVLDPLEGRDYPPEDRQPNNTAIDSDFQGNLTDPLTYLTSPNPAFPAAMDSTPAMQFGDLQSGNSQLGDSVPAGTRLTGEARVGGESAYVGTLRLKRLEEAIYQALMWSCPLYDSRREMKPCDDKNAWNPFRVYRIVGDKDGKKEYHYDGHIEIWTMQAFHNPKYQGLGEAIYRATAKLYALNAELDASCHYVDFVWSRRTKLCRGPRYASVGFPVDDDNGDTAEVQALAAVEVNYYGDKQDGQFDVSREAGDKFKTNVQSTFKTYYGDAIGKAIGREASEISWRVNTDYIWNCKPWFWFQHKSKCGGGD